MDRGTAVTIETAEKRTIKIWVGNNARLSFQSKVFRHRFLRISTSSMLRGFLR